MQTKIIEKLNFTDRYLVYDSHICPECSSRGLYVVEPEKHYICHTCNTEYVSQE